MKRYTQTFIAVAVAGSMAAGFASAAVAQPSSGSTQLEVPVEVNTGAATTTPKPALSNELGSSSSDVEGSVKQPGSIEKTAEPTATVAPTAPALSDKIVGGSSELKLPGSSEKTPAPTATATTTSTAPAPSDKIVGGSTDPIGSTDKTKVTEPTKGQTTTTTTEPSSSVPISSEKADAEDSAKKLWTIGGLGLAALLLGGLLSSDGSSGSSVKPDAEKSAPGDEDFDLKDGADKSVKDGKEDKDAKDAMEDSKKEAPAKKDAPVKTAQAQRGVLANTGADSVLIALVGLAFAVMAGAAFAVRRKTEA